MAPEPDKALSPVRLDEAARDALLRGAPRQAVSLQGQLDLVRARIRGRFGEEQRATVLGGGSHADEGSEGAEKK